MQRGRSTGHDANVHLLIASAGARVLAGCWSDEGVVIADRRSHGDGGIEAVADLLVMYVNE